MWNLPKKIHSIESFTTTYADAYGGKTLQVRFIFGLFILYLEFKIKKRIFLDHYFFFLDVNSKISNNFRNFISKFFPEKFGKIKLPNFLLLFVNCFSVNNWDFYLISTISSHFVTKFSIKSSVSDWKWSYFLDTL